MMKRNFLILSIITIFALTFINFAYATDVVMDLNSPIDTSNQSMSNSATSNDTTSSTDNLDRSSVDNTIYSSNPDGGTDTSTDVQEPTVTTTTDYEDSGSLSITNMINIVLIVVGIVLILLGIAIIIRLK